LHSSCAASSGRPGHAGHQLCGVRHQKKIGDPVRDMVGERVTPAEREVLRDELGLNDPFITQYLRFVGNAARGDLGQFFSQKAGHGGHLSKAPATLELVFSVPP
jgi:peptide/nickel transport system permease protein